MCARTAFLQHSAVSLLFSFFRRYGGSQSQKLPRSNGSYRSGEVSQHSADGSALTLVGEVQSTEGLSMILVNTN